jgi:hypothetical protein
MTGTQASPAHAGPPAAPAATARPHDPAGHHAAGRRSADLPLVARKKTAVYAPVLLGATAAALLTMAMPATASPVTGHDATSTVSISPIFGNADIVTGVRGTTDGNVVVTGSAGKEDGTNNTLPFLYQGPLTSPAEDSGFHTLTPPFPGFDTGKGTATFYGPDTSTYNPDMIPAGQVRAVGSYRTDPTGGVANHGMIYLGPVSGGGTWTTIDVPPDGSNTVGGVRACPSDQPGCMVMDTIAHSTMGNLVVGNYDLNLGNGVSGNAFIYNMTTGQWTLLQLGGSLASGTTLYGIWQNGGPGSPNYTLAGGSSAYSPGGAQRAFLMNYNERTGRFGLPRFYRYGNAPAALTHFDGITAVPGGFNLATISSAQASSTALQPSMAFIPATRGPWPLFGRATWYPIDVAGSDLCTEPPDGCGMITANTVYQNQVMGLYVQQQSDSVSIPGTYLATVAIP